MSGKLVKKVATLIRTQARSNRERNHLSICNQIHCLSTLGPYQNLVPVRSNKGWLSSIENRAFSAPSVSPQSFPHDTSSNSSLSTRKHFLTRDELNQQIKRLENHEILDSGSFPSDNDYFNALEACMEFSMEGNGDLRAAQLARALLEKIISNVADSAFFAKMLTDQLYDVVLQSYAVSGGGETAAKRAEELLDVMIQQSSRHRSHTNDRATQHGAPEPTIKTFNIVLQCWAKSESPVAGLRAQDVIRKMDRWTGGGEESWVNERSLVALIDAWTHSGSTEAPDRALAILQDCMFNPKKQFPNANLDTAVFNAVIGAWVHSNRGRAGAKKAEEILQHLVQWSQNRSDVRPNIRTYSMIMDAWKRSDQGEPLGVGYGAQRAENLLLAIVKQYREGTSGVLKPSVVLFSTCVAAWSRTAIRNVEAPDRVERLWNELEKLYNETDRKDADFRTTIEFGNAVILTWSRCKDRPDSIRGAIACLERMRRFYEVDIISYNSVLNAMSKKGQGGDSVQLLNWLERSSSVNGRAHLAPDIVTYNSVLAALSRSSDHRTECAQVAERLLLRMESLSQEKPTEANSNLKANIRPDIRSYTAVMNAWARSESSEKAQKAFDLAHEMARRYHSGDTHLKPDMLVWTVAIKACAHIRGGFEERQEALRLALSTMETLEASNYVEPSEGTYSTLFLAINRLSENAEQRLLLSQQTFERCAAKGQVSTKVIQELQKGLDIDQGQFPVDLNDLKPEWSINVPKHERPKRINENQTL